MHPDLPLSSANGRAPVAGLVAGAFPLSLSTVARPKGFHGLRRAGRFLVPPAWQEISRRKVGRPGGDRNAVALRWRAALSSRSASGLRRPSTFVITSSISTHIRCLFISCACSHIFHIYLFTSSSPSLCKLSYVIHCRYISSISDLASDSRYSLAHYVRNSHYF